MYYYYYYYDSSSSTSSTVRAATGIIVMSVTMPLTTSAIVARPLPWYIQPEWHHYRNRDGCSGCAATGTGSGRLQCNLKLPGSGPRLFAVAQLELEPKQQMLALYTE